jgi:molybdopterin/thiamine biosynthesis adenylyltransferase
VEVTDLNTILDNNHSYLQDNTIDTLIACEDDINQLKRINHICRRHNVKMVACAVYGVTGFVFNDLLDTFIVEDVEGETYKEVDLC